MILYHGSTVAVASPQIIVSDIGRDFGPAFYTTALGSSPREVCTEGRQGGNSSGRVRI